MEIREAVGGEEKEREDVKRGRVFFFDITFFLFALPFVFFSN